MKASGDERSGWVEGAQSGRSYPLPSVGVLLLEPASPLAQEMGK